MASITLPADGEEPYGEKLRAAINAVNDQVNEIQSDIDSGELGVSDAAVADLVEDGTSETSQAIESASEGVSNNSRRIPIAIPTGMGWLPDYEVFTPHLTIFPDGSMRGDIGMKSHELYGLFSPAISAPTHTYYTSETGYSGRAFADAVTTNGSPTLTSLTAWFTASDVGKTITGTGIPGSTTIASVQSSSSVTLSQNATASGTVTATIAGNAGTSAGAAFRSLRSSKDVATGATNKVRSNISGGFYGGAFNGFPGAGQGGSAQSVTRDTAYVVSGGEANIGPFLSADQMVFTGDSRYPYTDYMNAPAQTVVRVVDRILDASMQRVNSPTLCSQTPNSWCFDVQRTFADAVTTSGDATLTSATAAFIRGDLGRVISGAGIPSGTTITRVDSATQVTLSANATATASGVSVTVGTGRVYIRRADFLNPTAKNTYVLTDRNNFLLTTGWNVYLGSLDGSPINLIGGRATDTGGGDAAPFKAVLPALGSGPQDVDGVRPRRVLISENVSSNWSGSFGGIADAFWSQGWSGLIALFNFTGKGAAKDVVNWDGQTSAPSGAGAPLNVLLVNPYITEAGFGDNVSMNALTGHKLYNTVMVIGGVLRGGGGGTVRSDAATGVNSGRYILFGVEIGYDRGDYQTLNGVTPPVAYYAAGTTVHYLDYCNITQPGGIAIYVEAGATVTIGKNCSIVGSVSGPGTVIDQRTTP